MANPLWPATLPDIQYPAPEGGYKRTAQDEALRSPMDAGPPKARRRFSARAERITLRIEMTQAQVAALETFYRTTLNVVGLFDWIDHITRLAATYRFAAPPDYVPYAADWWVVTLELEKMP